MAPSSNSLGDVVECMCSNISGTGWNIIDNWFTSYELVHMMLNRHRLTVIGTLRGKNEKYLQPLSRTEVDRNTSLFDFQEKCSLLSYVPNKNKVVLLLSLMRNDDKIDESSGGAQIPEMITFYNKVKGGVNVVV